MTVGRVNLHPLFFGPEYSFCYLIIKKESSNCYIHVEETSMNWFYLFALVKLLATCIVLISDYSVTDL